jgi:hypothetical protein
VQKKGAFIISRKDLPEVVTKVQLLSKKLHSELEAFQEDDVNFSMQVFGLIPSKLDFQLNKVNKTTLNSPISVGGRLAWVHPRSSPKSS